jgi:hypothetical protein
MAVVSRILGYSLFTAGPGVIWFGCALSGHDSSALIALMLACVGAIVGAVAGAAGEIATAQRRLTRREAIKPMPETFDVGHERRPIPPTACSCSAARERPRSV